MKPILAITHERSGTHLLINIINYNNNGKFTTIGYIDNSKNTLDNYKWQVYKDIIKNSFTDNVCKSHHQVEFLEPYMDFILDKYKVIYLKRNIKDVLTSYYLFLFFNISNKPSFDEWLWSIPNDIGHKYLGLNESDPHIIIEPNNYIDRWKFHVDGWKKYEKDILIINYEDILNDYNNIKSVLEQYLDRKIGIIPDLNDKRFPNFRPNKGIIGGYKDFINDDISLKIDDYLKNK